MIFPWPIGIGYPEKNSLEHVIWFHFEIPRPMVALWFDFICLLEILRHQDFSILVKTINLNISWIAWIQKKNQIHSPIMATELQEKNTKKNTHTQPYHLLQYLFLVKGSTTKSYPPGHFRAKEAKEDVDPCRNPWLGSPCDFRFVFYRFTPLPNYVRHIIRSHFDTSAPANHFGDKHSWNFGESSKLWVFSSKESPYPQSFKNESAKHPEWPPGKQHSIIRWYISSRSGALVFNPTWSSKNKKTNYFTSSDPHHDISKQPR